MTGSRIQLKPVFRWQAILILLPVAVLAAIGWMSVRQDKILAQHDAQERAQTIANDLLPKIWNQIAAGTDASSNGLSFEIDASGRLVFPPPRSLVPAPHPLDVAQLNPVQLQLWMAAQQAAFQQRKPQSAIRAWRDFIDSKPPPEFVAAAEYDLGLLWRGQTNVPAASEMFARVAGQFPEALSEAGLPLRSLAQLNLLQLSLHMTSSSGFAPPPTRNRNAIPPVSLSASSPVPVVALDAFCSNAVFRPSLLTPCLLEQAQLAIDSPRPGERLPGTAQADANRVQSRETIRKWQETWERHELLRELYSDALPLLLTAHPAATLPVLPAELGIPRPAATSGGWPWSSGAGASTSSAPALVWFSTARGLSGGDISRSHGILDRNWLAVRTDHDAARHWFVCWSESELGFAAKEWVKREAQIPDYFGVGLEVGGRSLTAFAPDLRVWLQTSYFSPKTPGTVVKKEYSDERATNVLASAIQSDDGMPQLKLKVYVTSPSALFQRQRARSIWFGSLVLASALAALVGLSVAWRAFHRQQLLAEMKSNFVSSVSHELRAPIASMRLLAESLERGKVDGPSKQGEYFRFIVQECRRLSSLIENVLDFSRIEQGRKQYELEPTDVVALIRETLKLMEPYAAEKQVPLALALDEPQLSILRSQPVEMDGRAIQQALVNLIDNAIKHSPKDAPVEVGIELRSGRIETEDPQNARLARVLVLSVGDQGPGIPEEEHERIFERFYRRGSELRRETQGVGIGLSIVKHIVEAHGGRVRVESAVGEGSRFVIELPVNADQPWTNTDDVG